MIETIRHASFIASSYAALVVILGTLICWIAFDHRQQSRKLAALEARGLRRRSERS